MGTLETLPPFGVRAIRAMFQSKYQHFFDDIDECVLDKDDLYNKVGAAVSRVLSSAQLEYDGRFSVYEEYLCGMGLVKSEMTRRIFHVFSEYFLNKTPGVTLPRFESNKLSDFLKATIMFYGGSYIPENEYYIPMPPAWRPLPLEGGRRYQEDCADSRDDFSNKK